MIAAAERSNVIDAPERLTYEKLRLVEKETLPPIDENRLNYREVKGNITYFIDVAIVVPGTDLEKAISAVPPIGERATSAPESALYNTPDGSVALTARKLVGYREPYVRVNAHLESVTKQGANLLLERLLRRGFS
jgi:hypothetical protein